MDLPPLAAAHARGIALTTVIGSSFAAVWGVQGSAALPGLARSVTTLLVLAITLAWFGVAYAVHRGAHHLPDAPTSSPNPFRTRSYWLAVIAQGIAIPVVSRLLVGTGHPDAIMPAVAVIVGLHFFGLVPAFQSWRFGVVGGAMALLAVVSLTLAPQVAVGPSGDRIGVRAAVLGFGCAIILWGGVLPVVAATWRQIVQARA